MVERLQPLTSAAKNEVENLGHSVVQLRTLCEMSRILLLLACFVKAEDYYYKDDPPDPTDGRDVYYDTTTVATTSSEELYYDDEVLTTVNSTEPVLTSINPQEYGENRDVVKIVIKDKTSTPTAGAHADDSSSTRGPGRWHPNILLDIVSKLDEASKETVKAEEWVPDREPAAYVIPPTRVYLDDILQTTPMASQFADQNAFYEVDNMSERDRLGMAGRGLGKDSRRRDEDDPTRSTATHPSLTQSMIDPTREVTPARQETQPLQPSLSNEDGSEVSSTSNSIITTAIAEPATIAEKATIAEPATRARPTTEAKQSRIMIRTKMRRRKIKKLTIAHSLTRSRRKKTRYGTTTAPLLHIDVPRLIKIITNLTMDYSSNLTDLVNKTLQDMSNFSCPKLTTLDPTITTPVTVETTTDDPYGNLTGTIMAKCFVCGLEESMMPRDARCADAFAGDFIPLVAVDASAKKMVSSYRKYCRWMNVPKYIINETDPRSMWGRWTGGCSVRWIDISGIYTQRTCRNRHRAVMGNHWGSKRMAKLEMALQVLESEGVRSNKSIAMDVRTHSGVITAQQGSAGARKLATTVAGQYSVCFDNSNDTVNKTILFNLQLRLKRNGQHKKFYSVINERLVKNNNHKLKNINNKIKHNNNITYSSKHTAEKLEKNDPQKKVKKSARAQIKSRKSAKCKCANHDKKRKSKPLNTKHFNDKNKSWLHPDATINWAFGHKTDEVTNTLAHIQHSKDVKYVPISTADIANNKNEAAMPNYAKYIQNENAMPNDAKHIQNEVAMPNDNLPRRKGTVDQNNVLHLHLEEPAATKQRHVLNRVEQLDLNGVEKKMLVTDMEPTRTTEQINTAKYFPHQIDTHPTKKRNTLNVGRFVTQPTIYNIVASTEHTLENKPQDNYIKTIDNKTREINEEQEVSDHTSGYSNLANDSNEKSDTDQKSDGSKDSLWYPMPYRWDMVY